MNHTTKAALVATAAATALAVLAPVAAADTVLYMGGTCMCRNPGTGTDTLSGGYLDTLGTPAGVPYWAGLAFPLTIPAAGQRALDAYRIAHAADPDGKVYVSGTSQGALATHDLERRIMAMPEGDRPSTDELAFVVVADQANPVGGILNAIPALRLVVPVRDVDTPYDTTSITAEYDGYSDFPQHPGNLLAVANAAMGIVYLHPDYSQVDPRNPGTQVYTSTNTAGGVTTHYVVPTKDLPLTRPLRDVEKFATGKTVLTDEVDKVLRPAIDAGYDRDGSKAKAATERRAVVKAKVEQRREAVKAKVSERRAEHRAAAKKVAAKVKRALSPRKAADQ